MIKLISTCSCRWL